MELLCVILGPGTYLFSGSSESMLSELGPTIDVALLYHEHIQRVGPLLLGQAAWKDIH